MSANFDQLLLSSQELLSVKNSFIQEIQKASLGKESSVSFLRHTIPQNSPLKNGEIFQVMTIGGSVFKTALVTKKENECIILSEKIDAIPPFGSDQIFLAFIASHLDPTITYLSLNLAYPLDPIFRNNLLDGVLARGGKEHRFDGLVGKKVGETIENYVFSRLKRKVYVTVANDTVCLFISEATAPTWDTTVAGIIGTGTNYAIGMNGQIINLQSGGFNKFIQTQSGKIIDQESLYPGKGITDKEIAGAYLFKHFNIIAKENNFTAPPLTSTSELSQLAEKNEGEASKLAQIILERSASLAACQMAGIVDFISSCHPDESRDPLKNYIDPVSRHGMTYDFVMEGALFWEAWNYQEMLLKYLKLLKVLKKLRFSSIRHHSIRGGIKLLMPLR